jgi:hypothetical protein
VNEADCGEDSRTRGLKDSRTQGLKDSRTQGLKDSRTQRGVATTTKDAVLASLKTGVACSQGPRSPWARSVPLCFSKTVAHGTQCTVERAEHRRPQRTRRPIRNWVSVTTPLCLRNGPRETGQKTPNRTTGVGWEAHVTSRDPTERGSKVAAQKSSRNCTIFDVSTARRQGLKDSRSSGCKYPWREQILASNRPQAEWKSSSHGGRLTPSTGRKAAVSFCNS